VALPKVASADAAIGLVRARLLAVAEIQAIVGGRILGAFADDPDYATITKPAIAIEVAQGGRVVEVSGSILVLPLRIGCLSMESAGAARTLDAVVRAALQSERLTDSEYYARIVERGAPSDARFDEAKSWACVSLWAITVTRIRP
jgi:hypothetical protein